MRLSPQQGEGGNGLSPRPSRKSRRHRYRRRRSDLAGITPPPVEFYSDYAVLGWPFGLLELISWRIVAGLMGPAKRKTAARRAIFPCMVGGLTITTVRTNLGSTALLP